VQTLGTSDRTGLVDNVFTAAREGHVDYDVALQLAQYLRVEDDLMPWKAFAVNARYIDQMMIDSPHYVHWQVVSLTRTTTIMIRPRIAVLRT